MGNLIKQSIPDQHEADGRQATDDGVDKIEQYNLKLQKIKIRSCLSEVDEAKMLNGASSSAAAQHI